MHRKIVNRYLMKGQKQFIRAGIGFSRNAAGKGDMQKIKGPNKNKKPDFMY